MIPPLLRLLLRRLLLLMGAYVLLRGGFFLANRAAFQEASTGQVLLAFWHGFRFDVSAILLQNVLFMLLSLVPAFGRGWQRFLFGVYLLFNVPALALNIIDSEYFKFIGRRTSNELFTITGDIQRQAGQLVGHYWYLLIPFGLLVAALWHFYPMPNARHAEYYAREKSAIRRFGRYALEVGGLAILSVLGVRGGLQLKPLRTGHAFMSAPPILGHVVLNSTFTFQKSFGYESVERRHDFASPAALQTALAAHTPPPRLGAPHDNVVILLVESFASEYTGIENGGKGYTPFFDSLATKGLLFCDHYANGRRSIEALPAVLAGLPGLMESSFITSIFQTDELHGLGEILGRQGYATSVFHGAENGTMGFNTFSGIAGIQRYYGLNEYPGGAKSPDYDGHWGIFDEPYLRYFARELGQQKEPFLSTVFTLTSHEPFPVPAQYKGRFPAGELPIHASIGYTDFSLRQFFKEAARQPWYGRTLFILLADHTSQSIRPEYQNVLGSFKTPLLLFHPGRALPPADVHRITQQADITATVVDYLGLPAGQPLLPYGYSVFDSTNTGRAIFLRDNSHFLVHQDFVTELTAANQVQLYPYRTHSMPAEPLKNPDPQKLKQYGDELKACLQFFNNGLLDNALYNKQTQVVEP